MPNHEVSLNFPSPWRSSPLDVIVISDAPADSFLLAPDTLAGKPLPNRLRVLGEWVKRGGGFAMIGGWMSVPAVFTGRVSRAFLAHLSGLYSSDALPPYVTNRAEAPEGARPNMLLDDAILQGLPGSWPEFLGYNRLTDPSGDVLLAFAAGRRTSPATTPRSGKSGSPFHLNILPHWGSPKFLDWGGYVPFSDLSCSSGWPKGRD